MPKVDGVSLQDHRAGVLELQAVGCDAESQPQLPLEVDEASPCLQYKRPPQLPTSARRRYFTVFLFTLTAALLYADQNLLAPNLSAAAKSFNFNETQRDSLLGGYVMAAFFMVGAPSALLVGWLTDRCDRRLLLFAVTLLGEAPSLATYWVTRYWQFLVLRMMTGISVGGCFPLVFSLLGDLFPSSQRVAVSAVVQIATGMGIGVGQGLAGVLGPKTNWRLPFVVVAVPALLVSLVMVLFTEDPPRGAFEAALREHYAEGGSYEERVTLKKLMVVLRVPSNWAIVLQGLPGCLPWGMVLTFFNDFLSQNRHLSIPHASLLVVLFGAAGGPGVVVGGGVGQWLYNYQKEYMVLFAGGGILLGIGPLYYLVNADLVNISYLLTGIITLLGGFFAAFPGPILRAVMLNVNEPELRGAALALQSLTDDLGKGLGPFVVAWFISGLGRQTAFNIAVLGWVPCALLVMSLSCCMRRDELQLHHRLTTRMVNKGIGSGRASGHMDMDSWDLADDSPVFRLSDSSLDDFEEGHTDGMENRIWKNPESSSGGLALEPSSGKRVGHPVRSHLSLGTEGEGHHDRPMTGLQVEQARTSRGHSGQAVPGLRHGLEVIASHVVDSLNPGRGRRAYEALAADDPP